MENISGDTVIGKRGGSDCAIARTWYPSAIWRSPLLSADGSNHSLKVSSEDGDVDVYVGDGGGADIRTRGGESRSSGGGEAKLLGGAV